MAIAFINEKLIQFIWQLQYLNKSALTTIQGDEVQIYYPGQFNEHQGPDFLNARIKIGDTHWAGNVEIHIKTSDFFLHKHHLDSNYQNLVLHVVWQHDCNAALHIPTLELQPHVPVMLLDKYASLQNKKSFVACQEMLPGLNELAWINWKERLVIERLEQKTKHINTLLQESKNHWEEVFWWMLARNFGFKVNAGLFESMARSISINLLAKHKLNQIQLEALLMGQANLLNNKFNDAYAEMLLKEHVFLKKKYNLSVIKRQPMFLRMRPANFPTIRLSQLAALIFKSIHLFASVKASKDLLDIEKILEVSANDYWHYHFKFDEETGYKTCSLGRDMINNIIINTIVPMVFAYGSYYNDQKLKDKALHWLQECGAEKNSILNNWKSFSISNKNAFDSQALLQLYSHYCTQKQCLNCTVGNKILSISLVEKPDALATS